MKYVQEFRDPQAVHALVEEIRRTVTRQWVIMEICGGQTHAIMRYGLDQLLPPEIELVHGPGCPVCVTSLELIDKALAIAAQPGVIFASYGDMLRVPGSNKIFFLCVQPEVMYVWCTHLWTPSSSPAKTRKNK